MGLKVDHTNLVNNDDYIVRSIYDREARRASLLSSRPALSVNLSDVMCGGSLDHLNVLIWVNKPPRNALFQENPKAYEIRMDLSPVDEKVRHMDVYTTVPAILANLAMGDLFTLEWMSRYAVMKIDNITSYSAMPDRDQQLFKNILASAVLQINPVVFLLSYLYTYRNKMGIGQTIGDAKALLSMGWQSVTLGEIFSAELTADGVCNPINRLQLLTSVFAFPTNQQSNLYYTRNIEGANTNPHRELWGNLQNAVNSELLVSGKSISEKVRSQVSAELRSVHAQVTDLYGNTEADYGDAKPDFLQIIQLLERV